MLLAGDTRPLCHKSRGQLTQPPDPATDKTVFPVVATGALPSSVSPTGTPAGRPSGSVTISHVPPRRRHADTTGTR